MTERQRQHLEQRLLAERERSVTALRRMDDTARTASDEDGDLTTYPLHLADEGTDTMEQEKGFLLMSQEGRQLVEIDDALRRLYRQPDEFGKCEQCGKDIAFERLDMVPWATLCMACQRRRETPLPDAAPAER